MADSKTHPKWRIGSQTPNTHTHTHTVKWNDYWEIKLSVFEAFLISMKLCMLLKGHLSHVLTKFRNVLSFRFYRLLGICKMPFINDPVVASQRKTIQHYFDNYSSGECWKYQRIKKYLMKDLINSNGSWGKVVDRAKNLGLVHKSRFCKKCEIPRKLPLMK